MFNKQEKLVLMWLPMGFQKTDCLVLNENVVNDIERFTAALNDIMAGGCRLEVGWGSRLTSISTKPYLRLATVTSIEVTIQPGRWDWGQTHKIGDGTFVYVSSWPDHDVKEGHFYRLSLSSAGRWSATRVTETMLGIAA